MARWARCSAASSRPTATWGGRPKCSGCCDTTRVQCALRIFPSSSTLQGKPFLRAGVADPYGPSTATPRGAPAQLTAERIEDLLKRNGYIKDLDFDPVTRVAGALAFHTVADFKGRKVLEARSMATLFRGYEVIMIGRDPRDAIFITSRACGVCGGVHSVTSAMAIEMAIGCVPPPLGILIRNIALAARVPLRSPAAPASTGRPRLLRGHGGSHESIAARARPVRPGAPRRDSRVPHDRRPHGGPEPAHRASSISKRCT